MNRFGDIDCSFKKLLPVYGFHSQELVSLEQALQPIEPQIKELSHYVKIAKKYCYFPDKHGLSKDQSASIYIYTMEWNETSLYRILNEALRAENRQALKIWFPYLKLFDTALDLLPIHKGAIWRGVPLDIGKNFTENQMLTWWGVSSCSSSLGVIKQFLENKSNVTLFLIEAINGKKVSGYTAYQNEHEVILRFGTKFSVQGDPLKQMDGLYTVHLIEIDDNEQTLTTSIKSLNVTSKGSKNIWLDRHFHPNGAIKRPNEVEDLLEDPPIDVDNEMFDRVLGSLAGLALGDALGAFGEFRSHEYMIAHPVKKLERGGTWGLEKGQFTDDTSMMLCLANSLIARQDFVLYDQLVRYKWWFRNGYMASTGNCFDISKNTRRSLQEFEQRQEDFSREHKISSEEMDTLSDSTLLREFNVNCSEDGVTDNEALVRLAPVPLFFYRNPILAIEYSGLSAQITHDDEKTIDACRYYGALIVAAIRGESKEKLLDKRFYKDHEKWFGNKPLHPDILNIAMGSFKKDGGYADGIRGKGYVVDALQAALWAFWKHNESFEQGALAAVNLGDDTDTTAAIYGQLAGAYYGYSQLPKDWKKELYAKSYIKCLSKWITYEGQIWYDKTRCEQNRSNEDTNRKKQERPDYNSHLSPNDADTENRTRRRSHTRSNTSRTQMFIHPKMKAVQDVIDWLIRMDHRYDIYREIFMRHGIDAYWLLNQVTDADLRGYGIEDDNHRKHILREIKILQKDCPVK